MIYDLESHAAIVIYLTTYPNSCYETARRLGYSGKMPGTELEPGEESMEDWYVNLIYQFWLASRTVSDLDKKITRESVAHARIFLKHSFPAIPTLGDLAEEIDTQVARDGLE
jgi:hypothetical protein